MHALQGANPTEWNEARVLNLPAGEHDYFERKSGVVLESDAWRATLAKAVSAFANSGGGWLVLGVKDNGTVDGVRRLRGGSRTSTRDWLEQVIPNLVEHPVAHFRVHEIVSTPGSSVPDGRAVVVIEFLDSPLAPHQSVDDQKYYHRRAGRSEPASHFYLELLRNRLVAPRLEARLTGLEIQRAFRHEDHVIVQCPWVFRVENTGRAAAYKWALVLERIQDTSEEVACDYFTSLQQFPPGADRGRGVRIDDTLLPGLWAVEKRDFGLRLRPPELTAVAIEAELRKMLPQSIGVRFRVATEVSQGEWLVGKLWDTSQIESVVQGIVEALRKA